MLEVKNISKAFGGLLAVNDVSFAVGKGQIVGLIGPNGSGKSTVFKIISGFIPVSSGNVTFLGEDITGLPTHHVARRGMARTFQLVRPFAHLTALQNLMAGSMFGHANTRHVRDAEEYGMQILEQIGLVGKTHVKAKDLSMMERKWLEVGRALAGRPKLLLLDEFMAGLTAAEIPLAVDLIRRINALGVTVIIVEHIVKAITGSCERIIVLNAGQKIAEGTPAEIVSNPLVIDAYLGQRYVGRR